MTQPLWQNWGEVAGRLAAARHVLLGLDYDGTLTPIVAQPQDAHLAPRVRDLLAQMAGLRRASLALVSGRACADLQARVALQGVHYVGDHGMHLEGPLGTWLDPVAAAAAAALEATVRRLQQELARLPGAVLELKRFTASLHYRHVAEAQRADLAERLRQIVQQEAGETLVIRGGLCVWELRPRGARNKGGALQALVAALAPDLILYAGDDVTDEDAFAALPGQVTIKVGAARTTAASFAVAGPADVELLLHNLAVLLQE